MPAPTNRHRAVSPIETHFREATCREVNCRAWLEGWETIVPDPSEPSEFIRAGKLKPARRYIERSSTPGMVTFKFFPEQKCFRQHKMRLERDPFFLKNSTSMRGTDWVDDLSERFYERDKSRKEGRF